MLVSGRVAPQQLEAKVQWDPDFSGFHINAAQHPHHIHLGQELLLICLTKGVKMRFLKMSTQHQLVGGFNPSEKY